MSGKTSQTKKLARAKKVHEVPTKKKKKKVCLGLAESEVGFQPPGGGGKVASSLGGKKGTNFLRKNVYVSGEK